MSGFLSEPLRRLPRGAGLMALLLACGADSSRRPPLSDWPAETAAVRAPRYATLSSTLPAELGGIPFGLYHLSTSDFRPPFTGMVLNGSDPKRVMTVLEAARKAKIKVILNMFVSPKQIKNPDGSFSLERWKQRIDRFAQLDLKPYIDDGTLIGNYLLDEPHSSRKWNLEQVPFVDIEAAAQYSKQLWPGLATVVRADPVYLRRAPFQWVYLDAAWAQYSVRKGDVNDYVAKHTAAAKAASLGLILGLNVLDGGDGSSARVGTRSKYWSMTAAEISRYGSTLVVEPSACAFILWKYDRNDAAYFAQPGIRAAIEGLGQLAATRPTARCRIR